MTSTGLSPPPPPDSPDLSLLDLHLWGHFKDKVCRTALCDACDEIEWNICLQKIKPTSEHHQRCAKMPKVSVIRSKFQMRFENPESQSSRGWWHHVHKPLWIVFQPCCVNGAYIWYFSGSDILTKLLSQSLNISHHKI